MSVRWTLVCEPSLPPTLAGGDSRRE